MIAVVIVEPENSANVGAVARVMANFGFTKLVVVNPQCDVHDAMARCLAKHAQDVLKNAEVMSWRVVFDSFDWVVATTAKVGRDYNVRRSPMTPDVFAQSIKQNTKIAVVFGREGIGLTNEEVELCDNVVTIPASKKYPTLNVSHSVAVVLYELFKSMSVPKTTDGIAFASKQDRVQIKKMLDGVIDVLSFSTVQKTALQKRVWQRVVGRSFMTRREAFAVMGLLNKVLKKIR